MKICGEEIYLSGPPVNPEIRHLWDLENTGYTDHARACTAYSLWMANYDEIQIATFLNVSVEEIRADLAHICAVLPEEAVLLHTREREEIRDSVESAKKLREELEADLSVPIDELIKQSKDPIRALRRYREAVAWDEESIQLKDLRKKDANPGFDEKVEKISEEEELRLILALRQEANMQAKSIKMEKHRRQNSTETVSAINHDKRWDFAGSSAVNSLTDVISSKSEKTGRRITVRVNECLHARVRETAKALNIDCSSLIRELLERGLASGSTADGNPSPASLSILPEVFEFSPSFRAFCGDLRLELRKRFLMLLALGHEASQRWPKTLWVRPLFLGLLPLQKYLEDESVRQHGK